MKSFFEQCRATRQSRSLVARAGAALLVGMLLLAGSGLAKLHTPARTQTRLDSVAVDSLLFKISHAQKKISYSGVQERHSVHAGKPMRLRWRVDHWAPAQTLVRFLEPEALQNTIFYSDGKVFKTSGDTHVARSLRRGSIARSLQDGQLLEEIELLRQNYHVTIDTGAGYLERPIFDLKIEPKLDARPAFFAKVDAKTGVLLETRRLAANARADSAEQVSRFVEISYDAPPASLKNQQFTTADSVRQRNHSTQFHDMAALIANYKETLLIPAELPAGFVLQRIRAFQKEGKAFVHLHYSDGLSMISLFQRKNGDSSRRKDRSKRGKEKRQLSMVHGEKSGMHYHIVSEIAEAELQDMAASLVPITRKSAQSSNLYFYLLFAIVLVSGIYFAKRFREKTDV